MRFRLVVPAAVVLAASLAACGNAKTTVNNGGNSNGVTAHSIVVGGIASVTGPLPQAFAPVFDGVSAYFDMVNASGGINGRTIKFAYQLDDESDPAIDVQQARALVQSDHVFAVVGVATPSFNGASYLAANSVPTFGYNVNPQWSDGQSLFGYDGSYIDFEHPGPESAYLAEQLGSKRVGIIAYNLSQSADGCIGVANTMMKFHIPVAFEDLSISPPAIDLSADVNRMRAHGVDFVASCLDLNGNLVLSRALQAAGMGSVAQYWLDGYDEAAIRTSAALMDGVYLLIGHVPFESGESQPQRYPAMALYLKEIRKYFPGDEPSEPSLAGWVSAEMFSDALRAIGSDVTRARLVAAVNSLTAYTGGLMAPIDWKAEHREVGPVDCNVYVRANSTEFVPVFGSSRTVFTCFQYPQPSSNKVVVVPPPAFTPGG
ncbi:MAG: ABC transporter substrate-binding protein [Acidimicrobiales bacterium]|jgi:ABC-type branched-subunit amino acid transport system substrate-binding protein